MKSTVLFIVLVTILTISCTKQAVAPAPVLIISQGPNDIDQSIHVPPLGSVIRVQIATVSVSAQGTVIILLHQLPMTLSLNNGYSPGSVITRLYLYDASGTLISQEGVSATVANSTVVTFKIAGYRATEKAAALVIQADVVFKAVAPFTFARLSITAENNASIVAYYGDGVQLRNNAEVTQLNASYLGAKNYLVY